jgi:hypothetical protein
VVLFVLEEAAMIDRIAPRIAVVTAIALAVADDLPEACAEFEAICGIHLGWP